MPTLATAVCLALVALLATPVHAGKYGVSWNTNALMNYKVGLNYCTELTFRFRAQHSARVCGVRWYNITGPDYSGGTGGTITCSLQANHSFSNLPSGRVLATATLANPLEHKGLVSRDFDKQPALSEGTLYHLVFANTDPEPWVNYTSVNTLYTIPATVPNQPGILDLDLGTYKKSSGGSWRRQEDATPIFQLVYTTGTQGQGYYESYLKSPTPRSVQRTNSVDYRIKECLCPSNSLTSDEVWVRTKRVGDPHPLQLVISDWDGNIIAQGSRDWTGDGTYQWIQYTFPAMFTLNSCVRYDLVFSVAAPDTAADYYAFYSIKGGFRRHPDNVFGEGEGQFSLDGGATWNTNWAPWTSGTPQIQFYLVTQDPPTTTVTARPTSAINDLERRRRGGP